MPLPIVPAPITETCLNIVKNYMNEMTCLFLFVIAPFPGFNKLVPCEGIEDILWRCLASVVRSCCIRAQVVIRCFSSVRRERPGKYPSFRLFSVLAGNLVIVCGYVGVYKISLELFLGRPWPDDRGWKINSVCNQQLDYAVLVPFNITRNVHQFTFIPDRTEFDLVTF